MFFIKGAQTQTTISGIITDESNGEAIIGAIVSDSSGRYNISSQDGVFSLKTNHTFIKISYVGYSDIIFKLPIAKDTFILLQMIKSIDLQEVVIKNTIKKDINISSLTSEQLHQLPALGGKPDINRALQVLPGIKSTTEASGLLTIRGGDPGHNQYLIDNIPLAYVNHLGGFSSIFNPDIINKLDVYKGAFPAKYGGRLSSIIDITHTAGNQFKRKSNISLGLTDVSFTTEGPFKSNKWTYILSGRKTMFDGLLILGSSLSKTNNYIISYGYHDINSKLTWRPNPQNSMHWGFYYGDDYLNYWLRKSNDVIDKNRFNNTWGNIMVSSTWRNSFISGFNNNLRIAYTRYRINDILSYEPVASEKVAHEYRSFIGSLILKDDVQWSIYSGTTLNAGFSGTITTFQTMSYKGTSSDIQDIPSVRTLENAGYIELDIKVGSRISILPGLRTLLYATSGFSDVSVEPRFNIDWKIQRDFAVHASYMCTKQFSQLLINPGEIMRNEVWIPANKQAEPSQSQIVTLGLSHSLPEWGLNYEIVGFTKQMDHLVIYKEGYSHLRGTSDISNRIETGGRGIAYGLETKVNWKNKKWFGSMSYTYSIARRQFSNLNGGRWFAYDFDRPHTFTALGNFKLSPKIEFNASWTLQSGLPFTPAIGKFQYPVTNGDQYEYFDALIYGEKNSDRMKMYHRLDIGMNVYKKTKRGRNSKWSFSVYNVYNRRNPNIYYYNDNAGEEIYFPEPDRPTSHLKLYQMSYFSIIPTAAYTLFFNQDDQLKPRKKRSFKDWLEVK